MSRKNRAYKRGEPFRDAIKFVIACEGAERERQYFERIATDPRRLEVVVLAPKNIKNVKKNAEESSSSPKWVLNRLVSFLDEQNISTKKTGDIVWIVLDVDRWPVRDLIEITKTCQEQQWGIALSNPCFEVWLYLHVKEMAEAPATTCKTLKNRLGELELGDKTHYHLETYLQYVETAISRGHGQQDDLQSPVPSPLTTRVHLLVEQLIALK